MIRINTPEMQPFELEHISYMRKMAPECMVLLKNDGTMPLKKVGKIALYGNGARNTIKGGKGSGDVNVRHFVSVEEGLVNAGFEITTSKWLDSYGHLASRAKEDFFKNLNEEAKELGIHPDFYAMGKVAPEPAYELPLDGEGDTALYILARNSGECVDRRPAEGDINLTATEIRDILALYEKYKHFILVLNVGGMVDLAPVMAVKNILLLSQLGTETGNALADVLLGKSYPSGKLAMTWASIDDYPSTEGFGHQDDTLYKEGIYVGYRYFDKAGIKPLFPFGFGLGYTDFQIKSGMAGLRGNQITVPVRVKNTGCTSGKEIIQVYYSAPEGKLDKPVKELAAYAKTKELRPGEEQELTISFAAEAMASYDMDSASYILEKGVYYIRIGNCVSNTHICGAFSVENNIVTEELKNLGGNPGFEDMKLDTPEILHPDEEAERKAVEIIPLGPHVFETRKVIYGTNPKEFVFHGEASWEKVLEGSCSLEDFTACLSNEQLAYLCIGEYKDSRNNTNEVMDVIGNESDTVAGAAGETTAKLKDMGVRSAVLADGPAGLRLSTSYKLGEEEYYQYCIAIPIGTALAQSWNDELCRTCGDIVGKEMEFFGTPVWLAPAMNIQRSPLCGRNFEYYSEDPLISGRIAADITLGVQSHDGCGTTIKHFACNNQETNRYFSNSMVSERALREIYLKGFEICVKLSQPKALMTSYNLINGEHACNRKDLITSILREEWGYRGMVMTDWLVTGGVNLGNGKHPYASAAGCVKAGNDVVMPGMPTDKADIERALSDSQHLYPLTRGELQACAFRVLKMLLELNIK